jgi:ketosteroid isomerase-like protein
MKLTILFIVSMMLAPAQDQLSMEVEVGNLEARRFRAMTEADVPTLERLLSDDLVYTHASGWRQTKAEFLASLRSGELIYHSFAPKNFKARAYGNTVLVTGRASGKVRSKGQELSVELFYLEAYVKQDGRWQLAAWESTRVAP